MGYFNNRQDLINSTYIVGMLNLIRKYKLKRILDLGLGNLGKTSYYLNLYLGKDGTKDIKCIVPTETMKEKILKELNGEYSDNICVCNLTIDKDGHLIYDVDWSKFNKYKYNFISVDAPFISLISGGQGRIDILNIIKADKINKVAPYFIMFHDIDNEYILDTINQARKMLNCKMIKQESYILLTNQDL